jgi:hypothetical protein
VTATSLATEQPTAPPRAARRLRPDRPALVALAFGLVGVGYRLWLLLNHTPLTNSDEATMGLAALHIARGSGHPVFFYGQFYMGTPEAYLAAPLFRLFGPSVLAQRMPALLCYAAFLFLAYQLTRRLYRPWLAVLVVGLLALGADRVIRDQLIAAGGYPEIMPLGTAVVLLALLLATGLRRWRLAAFATWGLLIGVLVWDDWLIAPYVLAGAVILLRGCWRELLGWPALAVLAGAVAGASPIIYFNLRYPEHNSLDAYLATTHGPGQPLADRVHGAVSVGIALANGGCQPGRCGTAQQVGSWVYLILLVIAAGLGAAGLWRLRRDARGSASAEASPDGAAVDGGAGSGVAGRVAGIRLLAQLCLAGAALLTIVLYVRGPTPATAPLESARYLAPTQISLGAVLWPLWLLASRSRAVGAPAARRVPAFAAAALIAVLAGGMVAATIGTLGTVSRGRSEHRRVSALVDRLRQLGVTDVYSLYWTCNKLTFAAGGDVVCATVVESLHTGFDRYLPYRARVKAAADPAYVAPTDEAPEFEANLLGYFREHGITPTVTEVPGYRIYQTPGRTGLPLR